MVYDMFDLIEEKKFVDFCSKYDLDNLDFYTAICQYEVHNDQQMYDKDYFYKMILNIVYEYFGWF